LDKDILLEIDLKIFDKSINNCILQLDKLGEKIDKDIARLTYLAGNIIINEAKDNEGKRVHKTKNSGSLVRSLHCALSGVNHSTDQSEAEGGVDLKNSKSFESKIKGTEVKLELGSWLDYAYYVERGTKFMGAIPYLLPAMEKKFEDSVEYIVKGLRSILNSLEKK
jgi:hypothetical protein